MAIKIGIIGEPNTGKSFSRKTIKEGENVFIIAPSSKSTHITTSTGEPLKKLEVASEKAKSLDEMRIAMAKETSHEMITPLFNASNLTVSGNYVITKIEYVEAYLKFVDKHMPHIKTIILPDFTHFISAVLANKKFINRKSGGEAFQRFWELAADALTAIILSIDNLRDDLVVVTEYHSEYDEVSDTWKIFVPGGKMLQQAFKIDSYYDIMFYTHVEKKENGEVESYNFVTKKWDRYNARCGGIFKETLIPNDLEAVIKEVRKYNGI